MFNYSKSIFLLAAALLLVGCTAENVTLQFSLECAPCSKDLANVQQCQAFLERMASNDPVINQTAYSLGINPANVSYMAKKLDLISGKVTCIYFNKKPPSSRPV